MSDRALPPTEADLLAHAGFVRSLARALVRDTHAAEDLAQDVVVAALERPPPSSDRLRGWLASVARNLVRLRARSEARRTRRERAVVREPVASTTDEVERLETQRLLVDAVLALDATYRTVVMLRYFDGLSPQKIAARLGIPRNTVYTRLRRALATLRTRLEHRRRANAIVVLASVGGVALMSVKAKTVLAAALVVIAGLGAWMVARPPPTSRDKAPVARSETAPVTPSPTEDPSSPVPTSAHATDPSWDLHVAVRGPTGETIPGVVELRFLNENGTSVASSCTEGNRAHLSIAGSGRLAVTPRSGYRPRLVTGLSPPESGRQDLMVTLEHGLVIEGTVLDQDGRPCAHCRVRAEPCEIPDWVETRRIAATVGDPRGPFRGEAGRFRVEGLLPGRYRLRVEWTQRGDGVSPSPPPEGEAGDAVVEIRLDPSAVITLRIRDEASGEPIAVPSYGYRIQEGRETLMWWSGGHEVPFEIGRNESIRIRVKAHGYADSEITTLVAPSGKRAAEVSMRLRPDPGSLARVVVELRDDAGKLVEGVRLGRQLPGANGGSVGVDRDPIFADDDDPRDGRVELSLPPGRHVLTLTPPRESLLKAETLDVTVRRAEELRREIVFERVGAVRVKLPAGYRRGLWLLREDGSFRPYRGIQNVADGRILYGVPPGTVVVEVRRPDGTAVRKSVEVRAGEIAEVEMEPPVDPAPGSGTGVPEGW